MKLFKKLLILFILFFLIFLFYYLFNSQKTYQPISNKNDYYKNLNTAINTAKINTTSLQVRDYQDEIEFYLSYENNLIKVLLSTQKDPFWQISTLQQVVKKAKMNQEKIKLVDLSSQHPYVTLKNN